MTVRDRLRSLKLYNTHDLLVRFGDRGRDVAVFYYPGEARGLCYRAAVYSPSHRTDPHSAWYDQKQKTFSGPRRESVPAAIAWASARYGVEDWAVCPLDPSAKIPQYVRDRALATAKEVR